MAPIIVHAEEKVETIHIGPEDKYYGEVRYMKRITENGRLKRMEVYFTDQNIKERGVVYQYQYIDKSGRLYRNEFHFADWYCDEWGINMFSKYIDKNNRTVKCVYRFYDGTEASFEGDRLETIFTYIPKKASSHFQDYFFTGDRKNGETLISTEKEASSLVRVASRPTGINNEESSFLKKWLKTSEGEKFSLSDFRKKIKADENNEEVTFIIHSDIQDTIKRGGKYVICFHYVGGVYPRPLCVAVDALEP